MSKTNFEVYMTETLESTGEVTLMMKYLPVFAQFL